MSTRCIDKIRKYVRYKGKSKLAEILPSTPKLVLETSQKSIKLRMETESVLGPDKEYIIYKAIV